MTEKTMDTFLSTAFWVSVQWRYITSLTITYALMFINWKTFGSECVPNIYIKLMGVSTLSFARLYMQINAIDHIDC